jgi:NAD(P)-dependent dehydrogenase (short-subunit alcohol dehydrogenase family)
MPVAPTPLKGKTALVTGSTRAGIGATTALALSCKGANIVLNYGSAGAGPDDAKRAEEFRKRIAEISPNVLVSPAAVHLEDEVKNLFAEAFERFGSVDILVNNAGGTWIEQDFAAIDTDHWEQAIRRELDGTLYCIREALPRMREKRWGRIINIGLHRPALDLLVNTHYGNVLEGYPYDFVIAKHAKQEITRRLALAELKHGITINNILPGIIENIDNHKALEMLRNGKAQDLFFNPVDVANAIVYLCDDEARGITQSDIRIPGNIYRL